MKQIKKINGFSNYAVDTDGNVYSLRAGKKMSPQMSYNGYHVVGLYDDNGKHCMKRVHRLVAEAFIPNTDNKPCVNHRDEDKTNNNVSNLELVTVAENNAYGTRNERAAKSNSLYERTGLRIYCYESNQLYNSFNQAERDTGVFEGNIRHCCNGDRKHAGNLHFTYLNYDKCKIYDGVISKVKKQPYIIRKLFEKAKKHFVENYL